MGNPRLFNLISTHPEEYGRRVAEAQAPYIVVAPAGARLGDHLQVVDGPRGRIIRMVPKPEAIAWANALFGDQPSALMVVSNHSRFAEVEWD